MKNGSKQTQLLLDAGNSGIKIGFAQNGIIFAHYRIATQPGRTTDEYRALLLTLLAEKSLGIKDIDRIALSSVVPSVQSALCALFDEWGIDTVAVNPQINSGLDLGTETPSELGSDLLVNAMAAYDRFRRGCTAVAFGTALTFTTVSDRGELLGATIAPGLNSALKGLVQNTAKLPMVSFEFPGSAIGKNSIHSLQSGFMYGFLGLAEGIISRIRTEMGGSLSVVATGHEGRAFRSPLLGEYDPLLTFKGLQLVLEKN